MNHKTHFFELFFWHLEEFCILYACNFYKKVRRLLCPIVKGTVTIFFSPVRMFSYIYHAIGILNSKQYQCPLGYLVIILDFMES